MKMSELKPDRKPQQPSDDEGDVTLVLFDDDDVVEPSWLRDLCDDLVGLDSVVTVRLVLKVYLEHMLEDVKWGGTEV
jgi:hypothetical protein